MCHLKAATGKHTFILVILLAPIRFRGGTATASARFGHGCSGIYVPSKEKHSNVAIVKIGEKCLALKNVE